MNFMTSVFTMKIRYNQNIINVQLSVCSLSPLRPPSWLAQSPPDRHDEHTCMMSNIFANRRSIGNYPLARELTTVDGMMSMTSSVESKKVNLSLRVRSHSCSAKRGRQRSRTVAQETTFIESESKSQIPFVLNKTCPLPSAVVVGDKRRFSLTPRSRSSSLSGYYSSKSSSSTASDACRTFETPEEFWNKYRRKSRRPSLSQLVIQALSPKRKEERHPSSPPHSIIDDINTDSEPEYSEIYGENL